MKNCYVTICAMNMKWGVIIMNDEKRMVAGHVKDGRLAVYDMKGNLLCNASPEDEAFIMNVKHAFSVVISLLDMNHRHLSASS